MIVLRIVCVLIPIWNNEKIDDHSRCRSAPCRQAIGSRPRRFAFGSHEAALREMLDKEEPAFSTRWRGQFQAAHRDGPRYAALARKYL